MKHETPKPKRTKRTKPPGSGRPSLGRKHRGLRATDAEWQAIQELLAKMRMHT